MRQTGELDPFVDFVFYGTRQDTTEPTPFKCLLPGGTYRVISADEGQTLIRISPFVIPAASRDGRGEDGDG